MSRASSSRAALAWISWPQTAFSSECVTVAVRSGRSPRRLRTARPISGSSAKRRRNGVVVVVGREHEAEPVERLLGLGGLDRDGEGPVRALAHARERRAAGGLERHGEDAVAEVPRRVAS